MRYPLEMKHFSTLLLLSLFLSSTLFTTPTHAQREKSESYWKQKIKSDPDNSVYLFNFANFYQRKRKYQKSILLYRRLIKKNSKLKYAGMLYLGRAYYRSGKKREALSTLNAILRSQTPSSSLKVKAQNYINKFEMSEEEELSEEYSDRFRGGLEIKSGYNSNPYLESDSGLDIVGETQSVEPDRETQYAANLGFKYFSGESADAKINLYYTKIDFTEDSTANRSYMGGDLPLTYYTEKLRYRLTPGYSTESDAEEEILATSSGEFELTYKRSAQQFSLALIHSNYSAFDSLYTYLSGERTKLKFSFSQISLKTLFLLRLSAYQKNLKDSDLLTQSHNSAELSLSYAIFWKKISSSISGGYRYKIFKIDVIEELKREDDSFELSAKINYSLFRAFKLFLEADYILNQSNFDGEVSSENFNYSKWSALIGGKVSF
ncbi:hypothetical protein OAQ84_00410 [Bdellovibrionales bacterium]|nr:hypothetical protein [Bdellovibrionales bacterium]